MHLRARLILALASSGVLLTTAGAADAQEARGFAVNRFEPSERGSEWFAGDSLDLRGHVRPVFGVVGDYAYRSLVIYGRDDEIRSAPVRHMAFAHLGASVTLYDRVRFAFSLPLQAYASGEEGRVGQTVLPPPQSSTGIGDLRLGADVRVFGRYGGVATGAVGLQVWAPTGDRDQYNSDGYVRIRPRALVAGQIGVFAYAAQVNLAYRGRADTIAGGSIGSELGFALSAGLRALGGKLVVGPELFGSTVLDDFFGERATPLEGIFGAHYQAGDFRFGAGVGSGLTRGFGTPAVRGLLGVEWAPRLGKEPSTGIAGATADDRDGDGIDDALDACPGEAGAKTDDPKTNGCPLDRDHDGIVDEKDACPDAPGVSAGGAQGCPPDSDGDGVDDLRDACPTVRGVRSDDPKLDGCPDPDRDRDGIANVDDACPDAPGPRDADLERSGCPKAFLVKGAVKILDQVKFKTGSAEIDPGKESEEILGAVLAVLQAHPELKKLRVEGYTDDRGAPAANKALSANRAASVVAWLVAHGVDKDRLVSRGLGEDDPIDTNETEAGRRNNRRVEFHVEP